MNKPHKNARTCLYSREQIVERYRSGVSVREIAAAFAISIRTVYKWLKRFREEGVACLSNRAGTPSGNPNAYAMGWRALIVKLRSYRMTAFEIAAALE